MTCICKKITEFGIFTIGDSYEYSIEKHDETGILLYNIKLPFGFSLPGSIKSPLLLRKISILILLIYNLKEI